MISAPIDLHKAAMYAAHDVARLPGITGTIRVDPCVRFSTRTARCEAAYTVRTTRCKARIYVTRYHDHMAVTRVANVQGAPDCGQVLADA
jgi:hypothetical protein